MKRRLLSLLMTLGLLLTLAPMAMAVETEEFDTWDGTANVNLAPDSNGIYQINTAEDLAQFAVLVNGGQTDISAELNTGIDLNELVFTPIGAYAYKQSTSVVGNVFEGTFDGKGHVIKNGSISDAGNIYCMGIFGFVDGGTVKNLTVSEVSVDNSKSQNEASTGVVIGSLYKGNALNLVAKEGSSAEGINRVGGVIGSVRDNCTVTDCKNYAEVTGTGMYSGGVIGASHDIDYGLFGLTGAPATITGCYNYGSVNGNTEVGGIVGYSDQATITDCHNSGAVTATGNYGTGGIVGFDAYNPRGFFYKPNIGSDISECTNSAAISGGRAAGIVGTLGVTPGNDQPSSDKTLTRISECTNTGTINGTSGKCGAIFGYQITYAHGDGAEYINHLVVKITNCTIGETVTVNGESVTAPTSSAYYTN